MTSLTIRILDGMEKGRIYSRLALPITVGREDGNLIQLNDERISRFHAKFQEQSGRIILTDLASTNGTRVNGYWINMRILQVGDLIVVGRCILQLTAVQATTARVATEGSDPHRTAYIQGGATIDDDSKHLDFADPLPESLEDPPALFPHGCPELPTNLDVLQQAQLSDLLSYFHERIGQVLRRAKEQSAEGDQRVAHFDWELFSYLIDIHADLTQYIVHIDTPEL